MSETDQADDSRIAAFLKDHPRAMGILFALMLALTQVPGVIAGGGSAGSVGGP